MDHILRADHEPSQIAARLDSARSHSYLGDAVLGSIDGGVTTFAIVAGAAGASLSPTVALILGVFNMLADGFSMAASNYQRARSERQRVELARRIEERHIEQIPEGEREEIRQIFERKGFTGDVLEEVVRIITTDRRRWVDTMLTEELGLQLDGSSPARAAYVTFLGFVFAGSIPLLPFVTALFLPVTASFSGAASLQLSHSSESA